MATPSRTPVSNPVNAGDAVNVVFNGGAGVDDWILEDSPNPGEIQVRSTTGAIETTTFANPTSLTINLGDGNDTFTLESLGDSGFSGSIAINTEGGDDTITVSGFTSSATYSIDAGTTTETNGDTIKVTRSGDITLGDGLITTSRARRRCPGSISLI